MVEEFSRNAAWYVLLYCRLNDPFCCIHCSRLSVLFSGPRQLPNLPFQWGISTHI